MLVIPKQPDKWSPWRRQMFTRDALYRFHCVEELSHREIAGIHKQLFNIHVKPNTIKGYLIAYGIFKNHTLKILHSKARGALLRLDHPAAKKGRVPIWVPIVEEKYKIQYDPQKHRVIYRDSDKSNVSSENLQLKVLMPRKCDTWSRIIKRRKVQLKAAVRRGNFGEVFKFFAITNDYRKRRLMGMYLTSWVMRRYEREGNITENQWKLMCLFCDSHPPLTPLGERTGWRFYDFFYKVRDERTKTPEIYARPTGPRTLATRELSRFAKGEQDSVGGRSEKWYESYRPVYYSLSRRMRFPRGRFPTTSIAV